MHTRRLITFLLGLWFALILTIGTVTTVSLHVAQNVAKTPPGPPSRALVLVGQPMTAQIFQFIASEINRTLFEMAGIAELAVVFALACLLLFNNYSRTATILAGVLLLMTFASQFLLVPQMVAQGRLIDFRPDDMMLTEVARFASVRRLFGLLAVLRILCVVWISGILLFRGPNSRMRRRGSKVDTVDDAKNSHIDG
jgi:hypothetical protein